MEKSAEAFRTISEVADLLETPAHVLRFWESRFPQIRPVKRAGGRRYYRPSDIALLTGIKRLLHDEGLTIRGVQKVLREQGIRFVADLPTQSGAVRLHRQAVANDSEDGDLDGDEAPDEADLEDLPDAAEDAVFQDMSSDLVIPARSGRAVAIPHALKMLGMSPTAPPAPIDKPTDGAQGDGLGTPRDETDPARQPNRTPDVAPDVHAPEAATTRQDALKEPVEGATSPPDPLPLWAVVERSKQAAGKQPLPTSSSGSELSLSFDEIWYPARLRAVTATLPASRLAELRLLYDRLAQLRDRVATAAARPRR